MIGSGNDFLGWNTTKKVKRKNKLDFMKIKSLCAAIYQIINDVNIERQATQ